MISAAEFVESLSKRGFRSFTGVPCSFFQAAINRVISDSRLRYTIAPNEGSALALAAGSALAGEKTAVLIQNSGLGNLINPLTSLNMIYGIPALIFVSGRAYGVEDEPQHEIIGKTMGAILDALEVQHSDLPDNVLEYEKALDRASDYLKNKLQPYVFFVRKGTVCEEGSSPSRAASSYPMKRIDAIKIISDTLSKEDYLVATTGKPSRELFSICDRPSHFYMQGSMGHATSIGLGVALASPTRRTVILDGDGAALMHLGAFSMIGHYAPKNLYHVMLDNESYETTGDQDTTSSTTDFCAIALACGYKESSLVKTEKDLRETLKTVLATPGPTFLRVKINREATENIPRISSKHSSKDIARNFSQSLKVGLS